jgi:hypothetical protein
VELSGTTDIVQIDLVLPAISRHVIAGLDVTASGRVELDLKRERLVVDEGELSAGKVDMMVDASITGYRSSPVFELHVKVPTVSCEEAIESLVRPIAPMLSGTRCRGTLAFRLDLNLDMADMKSLKFEFEPTLRNIEIKSLGRYIDFELLGYPFEHHARQVDGTLYTFITGPGSERWVPLDQISQNMTKVVTTTEDGSFFTHNGFSIRQIRNAMVANLGRGRFVRGASTISQQMVKNLYFVEREKTLSRKLQEAVITWEMERSVEKEQILELYFNIIEFGPKIYGIKAAANHYFNRSPGELTLLQAIWLGSIIPAPRKHYQSFIDGEVPESRRKLLCWIGRVMVKREKITEAELARLGECNVVFGGGSDGSEAPPGELPADEPLGYVGDPSLDSPPPPPLAQPQSDAPEAKSKVDKSALPAPSVDPGDQP